MNAMTCTACSGSLELGYLEESGHNNAKLGIRWIVGPVVRGFFTAAKRQGRVPQRVDAWRCVDCSRLELFVALHH